MAKPIEFWTNLTAKDPRAGAREAARLEAAGWDGVAMVDSQCMFPDVWMYLALCAQATARVKLATGVTNSITRHPSVTASAASSLQLISGGRSVLGVGRGDSALAYVGASPMPIGRFEEHLAILQQYLRDEDVPMEVASSLVPGARGGFDNLAIGTGPAGSRIKWLADFDMPKVPLEAFATGPKAIEAAARAADAVILGLAAEPNRIGWGVDIARKAAAAHGRSADALKIGAYVCVVPHPDVAVARRLAAATVATMARFSVMNKRVIGPATERQVEIMLKLAQVYNMNTHGKGGAQIDVLDDEFIDQFGIVGTVEHCIRRICHLSKLGVDRLTLFLPLSKDPEIETSYRLLANEVLPAAKAACA